MLAVPKKKPPARSGAPVFAYVPQELRDALDDYLNKTKPKPSLTAAIETALEEFLQARGFWPPHGESAEE